MLASAVNPLNRGDSTMPGEYESWRGPLPGVGPRPATPFPQLPLVPPPTAEPSMRTPFPRLPMVPTPAVPRLRRPPMVPIDSRLLRPRRRRRRPLTPDIVIDRRRRCHSSWGRNGVITVPLDNRPTLGLRGPPKRVLEIERVRCHQRCRPRSLCYEEDYYHPPPPPLPPLPPTTAVIANPIPNPCLPPANNVAAVSSAALFSNLTPEMINNLPKQTVHLPPIHLPGSQADTNTELDIVTLPTEIINPVDGTLSVIQANPGAYNNVTTNIQPTATIQPQLLNISNIVGTSIRPGAPPISPAMAADPMTQRFRELFQRLVIPQTQPIPPAQNPPIIRPTLPTMSQFDPANNTAYNSSTVAPMNTANTGLYPPANIRPANTSNIGSYRPANTSNIGSYRPANNTSYPPTSIASSGPASIPSYRPPNSIPSGLASNPPYRSNMRTYPSANITSSDPVGISSYPPTNSTPSGLASNPTYRPINTTSYGPSTFTPSIPASNPTYRSSSIAPSNASDIGPYRPANITPYINMANRSNNNFLSNSNPYGPTNTTSYVNMANPSNDNSLLQPSSASNMNPYDSSNNTPYVNMANRPPDNSLLRSSSSSGPITSLSSFTPFPNLSSSRFGNNSINPSTSFPSLAPTTYQSSDSMPKSILRNTPSGDPSNRFNPSNSLSSNDIVRKATTFT